MINQLEQFSNKKSEIHVLSPCLWSTNDYLIKIYDHLELEDFYFSKHRVIWEAILYNFAKGIINEPETVYDAIKALKLQEISVVEIFQLKESVPSGETINYHADKIKALSIARQFIKSQKVQFTSHEDIYEIISNHQKKLLDIVSRKKTKDVCLIEETKKQIQVLQNKLDGKKRVGYKWNSEKLTRMTGGIEKHFVYVYGAREKSGKSKWIIDNIVNLTREKVNVLFFSLEMIEDQVTRWLWSRIAEVDSLKIKTPSLLTEFEKAKLKSASEKMINYYYRHIALDTRPFIGITELKASIIRWLTNNNIDHGVVFLDFLQRFNLNTERGESKANALERTTRQFADIAKELPISFIYMSQLKKKENGVLNTFDDLLGSGGIAQNANVIILANNLYRVFGRKVNEGDENTTILNVLQRDGESADLRLTHDLAIGKFEDKVYKKINTESETKKPF